MSVIVQRTQLEMFKLTYVRHYQVMLFLQNCPDFSTKDDYDYDILQTMSNQSFIQISKVRKATLSLLSGQSE